MDSQLDQALTAARSAGWTVVIRGVKSDGRHGAAVEVMSGERLRRKVLDTDWLEEQSEPEDALAATIQELIRDE